MRDDSEPGWGSLSRSMSEGAPATQAWVRKSPNAQVECMLSLPIMHAWAIAETQAVVGQLVGDGMTVLRIYLHDVAIVCTCHTCPGCALPLMPMWANLHIPSWLTVMVQSALIACILTQYILY